MRKAEESVGISSKLRSESFAVFPLSSRQGSRRLGSGLSQISVQPAWRVDGGGSWKSSWLAPPPPPPLPRKPRESDVRYDAVSAHHCLVVMDTVEIEGSRDRQKHREIKIEKPRRRRGKARRDATGERDRSRGSC